MGTFRVAVLASGRGTGFQALAEAAKAHTLGAELVVLVCNNPEAPVIARAQAADIPIAVIDHRGKSRAQFEEEVLAVLQEKRVDLVVLAGFMRIVTATLLSKFPLRVINIHPSLLPAFAGAHAHEDALRHGAKVSGCTIHFVDESTDGGPILLQKAVEVLDDDTAETLANRILEWEHVLLPLAVRLIAEGRVTVEGRKVMIDRRGLEVPPFAAGPARPV